MSLPGMGHGHIQKGLILIGLDWALSRGSDSPQEHSRAEDLDRGGPSTRGKTGQAAPEPALAQARQGVLPKLKVTLSPASL